MKRVTKRGIIMKQLGLLLSFSIIKNHNETTGPTSVISIINLHIENTSCHGRPQEGQNGHVPPENWD